MPTPQSSRYPGQTQEIHGVLMEFFYNFLTPLLLHLAQGVKPRMNLSLRSINRKGQLKFRDIQIICQGHTAKGDRSSVNYGGWKGHCTPEQVPGGAPRSPQVPLDTWEGLRCGMGTPDARGTSGIPGCQNTPTGAGERAAP